MSVPGTTLAHDTLVQASWARCHAFGLNHQSPPDFGDLSPEQVRQLQDSQQALLQTTHQEVLPYYENILGNSNCLILLADAQGHLLKSWGNQRFVDPRLSQGFVVGACWQEQRAGTNAIGTALASGQAVHIEHDEHFLKANRFMTGSASPIFDAERRMVAVLDVSSDSYLPPSHTLGMVRMMSQTVENRLILACHAHRHFQLTFNTGVNNLDSQWAGLLIFDEQGNILAANRRADSLLGSNPLHANLEALFKTSMTNVLSQSESGPFSLQAAERNRFQCLLKRPTQPRPATPAPSSCTDQSAALLGDPRLEKALLQGLRGLEKNIPLLIRGETGVGKEVFVKALHRASSRANRPLVAVNCAAIPAELVESELFGYEKGAFTGAHHKGNPGLIRKADHGILFLDEIGDMPLPTQARLLRFLQERSIQPLGSGDAIMVDIRVISATNHDLRTQVHARQFREDLYYRIGGLTLELPPLRERSDRRALIEHIWALHREPEQSAGFTDKVLELFMRHAWPGNVRQLSSVIQVALIMAQDQTIGVEHLPETFFSDLQDELVLASSDSFEAQVPVDESSDLVRLLREADGNISQLARRLGVSRNTLYKRLRALGL
ncbi:sigma-54-dependent Fis family transcriptional regulator [Pseudomonas akapageensis]|uniref:sigma-54-dependent Fis family transcriptional regulator n=1 Tax=Pseudomonas akapageensis TaxID=2609961 RepID=UPI00140918E1|nr:sigma-54-dependent Fis family transcriptional regulator [Pseudomonas akapageensis]